MKSKVLSWPNFSEIEFLPDMLNLKISSEEVDSYVNQEFERISKKNGEIVEADSSHEIELDDIVMMRVKSSIPKFNKPMIPVTVGKNLYNKFLEESILGLRVRDKKSIEIDGENVEIEILKIKSKDIPELTIDMVKDEFREQYPEICESITTIDDFKDLLIQDFYENYKAESFYNGPFTYVRNYIISSMKVDLCKEELENYREKFLASIEKSAISEGISKKEYLKSLFGDNEVITDENLMDKVNENIEKDFYFKLYANVAFDSISEEESKLQYEAFVEGCSLEYNISKEDVMKDLSYDEFVEQNVVMNAQNMIFEKYMQDLVLVVE